MKEKSISIEQALENVGSLAEFTNSKTDWKYIKRPDGKIERVVRILQDRSYQQKFLLAGQDGCGKTTELNRLEELASDFYTVIRCDHRHFHDLDQMEDNEFLMVLLQVLFSSAEMMPEGTQQMMVKSLESVLKSASLSKVEIEASSGTYLPFLSKLFLPKIVKTETFYKETPRPVEFKTFRSEINAMIHKAIEVIREAKGKPVLLIVDDLEKIQYEKVYRLMAANYQLLSLFPCAVVYTVPLWLFFSDKIRMFEEVFNIINLANIPMINKYNENVKEGYRFFEKSAGIRLGNLWTNLGEAIRKAISFASGGNIRQFFSILRSLLLEADRSPNKKIENIHVKQIFNQIVSNFRRILNREDRLVLEGVRATREFNYSLPPLLLNNFSVLEYWLPDEGTWYDVSPLVLPDHPQCPMKIFSIEKETANAR